MDYDSLVGSKTTTGSIKEGANWSLLDSEGILAEAEAWIYGLLRVRQMLVLDAATLGADADTLAIPTRYRKTLSFRLQNPGYVKVKLRDPQLFEQYLYVDSTGAKIAGCPTNAMMIGTTMHFNRLTDQTYSYRHVYHAALAHLASDNLSNFLTDDYPTLLRTACLYRAFDRMKQFEAAQRMEQQAQAAITQLNSEYDQEQQEYDFEINWEGNE